jgi:hypothetical protein
MRIDSSGNVGIGTASPSNLLHVSQASSDFQIRVTGTSAANAGSLRAYNDGGQAVGFGVSGSTNSGYGANLCFLGSITNIPQIFITNNTERARIDSSGNLLVGTTTANGLLTVAGIARGGIAHRAGTYTAGSTTPSVSGITFMTIANSSATTITNFTNGVEGQIIYLYFADTNTTINRSNAYLSGGANFTSTHHDILALINYSGFWYEVSRSVNA